MWCGTTRSASLRPCRLRPDDPTAPPGVRPDVPVRKSRTVLRHRTRRPVALASAPEVRPCPLPRPGGSYRPVRSSIPNGRAGRVGVCRWQAFRRLRRGAGTRGSARWHGSRAYRRRPDFLNQVPPLRVPPATRGTQAACRSPSGPVGVDCEFTTPPRGGRCRRNPGGVLLSQGATPQVPSALAGLTAVFGMGTGVSPPPWPPEIVRSRP